MRSLVTHTELLDLQVAATWAQAGEPFSARSPRAAFAAFWRLLAWQLCRAAALLATMGLACGSVATAQAPQLYNWTTAVGGSSVFGPVSMALDRSGNLYVVNNVGSSVIPGVTGSVYKIPASDPTCSTPGDCINIAPSYDSTYYLYDPDQNYRTPIGVAVDDAGNVFIQVAYNYTGNNTFVRVPSTDLTCSTPGDCIETPLTGYDQGPLAVDGSDSVYFSGCLPNDGGCGVVKSTLSGNTYTSAMLFFTYDEIWGTGNQVTGMAADASGNLFLLLGGSLVEYALSGGTYTPTTIIPSNFLGPLFTVAVDWSGNIYVSGQSGLWKFTPSAGGAYTQSSVGPGDINAFTGDASGDLYIGFPYGGDYLYEIHTGPVNFGAVQVGATSPAIQLNFLSLDWNGYGPSGPSPVLTQGAAGLDFIPATNVGSLNGYPAYPSGYPDGSCGNYYQSNPCYVYLQFAPTKPGERQGAAGVLNNSGATVGTTLIQGIGVSPQAVIYPGTQSAPYTASSNGLSAPSGLALDGFGDVYIADTANNQVIAQVSNGQIAVANAATNGLASPAGIALDGNGDVYIADSGNSRIVEEILSNPGGTAIEPGSGYSYTQAALTTSALSGPKGVAVDGAGDIYIADTGNNRVLMETLAGGAYTETTLGSELAGPDGVAVDGSGNVYIADTGNGRVLKETLSGGVYTQSEVAGGLSAPQGVAVDGSGNVYIADTGNNRVLMEANSGGVYTQILAASGLNSPEGVTVSSSGNVYIADTTNQRVVLVDVSDPQTLTFSATTQGSSSSPQTLTLVNIGNAPLSFAVPASGNNPAIGTDFSLSSSGSFACPVVSSGAAEAGTLAAGADCELSISFDPTTTGALSESMVLTDNSLNGTNVSQTVTLNGDAHAIPSINWPTPTSITYGTALSATQLDATASVAGTYSYNPPLGTVLTAGSQTLTATFTPTDAQDYTTAMATVTLQVTQATPTITWAAPLPITQGTALSATQLDAIASVQGTLVYTPALGTVPALGSQTLSVKFTPTDTVDYAAVTASVTLTVIAPGSTPAQPAFSVVGGTYPTAQLVAITDASPGATIYYTTNGSTPTTSSLMYAGPIPVTASETINAVAGGGAYNLSSVATAAYTLTGITQIISTVAGDGAAGYSGDNGPATSAELNGPYAVLADGSGNFYIADYFNSAVRKVTSTGKITTIAGNGTAGYSGDDGPATSAELSAPAALALDSSGNLYIGDRGNNTVRKVTPAGIISTVAGNGTGGSSGDNGQATSAQLNAPYGLAFDAIGNLYISEYSGQRVRKVTPAGTITTIAGNGGAGYSGDNGPATSATLNGPDDIAIDLSGNLYINDDLNSRIRMVSPSGTITTIVGNGGSPGNGDGGPAISATLNQPHGVTVDANGFLYIADTFSNRIRRVDQFGTITTVAGNGQSNGGDGGPAFDAGLNLPTKVSVDAVGNYYIADLFNYRIRKVTVSSVPQGGAPTINWPTPAAISYGTALSATQLDATANVPGTFVYTPALGSVLTAGTQTLSATFTPTNTAYYATTTVTVTLQVTQVTTTISWTPPTAITGGTALSGTQLDATASEQGTFVYTPAAGTVLPFGALTLSVTFTPYDAVDYTTATASVPLTVLAPSGAVHLSGYQVTTNITAGSAGYNPQYIAVDGNGNIFFTCYAGNPAPPCENEVIELTPSGGTYTASVVIANVPIPSPSEGIGGISGIAVDQSDNLYISDENVILKETLSAGSYTQSVIASPPPTYEGFTAVSVDSRGNVYALSGGSVFEVSPSGGGYALSMIPYSNPISPGSPYISPSMVLADGNGNIYIYANSYEGSPHGPFLAEESPSPGGYIQTSFTSSIPQLGVSADGVLHTLIRPDTLVTPYTQYAVDTSGNIYSTEGGPVYKSTMYPAFSSAANFGDVAVGSCTGPLEGTSCNTTPSAFAQIMVSSIFTFDFPGTLGNYLVDTGGDFGWVYSSSCTNLTFTAGQTCAMDIAFSPITSGVRHGAVYLADSAGNTLATGYFQGTGVAPGAVIYPGVQSVAFSAASSGLSTPGGMAIDDNADLYIADTANNRVVAEPNLGSDWFSPQVVVASGLSGPTGVGVDGSGAVFIADTGNNRVVKEALAEQQGLCINGTCAPPIYTQSIVGSDLSQPQGVATDGAGNVYISDTGNNRILLETPTSSGYTQSVLVENGLSSPTGIAVDGSGDLFIANAGSGEVVEETLSGGIYTQSTVASGLSQPQGVSLDAAGDVYIADSGNNRVLLETPSNGGYAQMVIASGLNNPQSVLMNVYPISPNHVSGYGFIYIADSNNQRVLQVDVGDPQTLNFATTPVGGVSSDSPRAATLLNIGNAPLQFTVPSAGSNPSLADFFGNGSGNIASAFTLNSGGAGDCPVVSAGALQAPMLAAGATCQFSFSFTPNALDPGQANVQADTMSLVDNSNNGYFYAYSTKQAVILSGNVIPGTPTITWAPPTAINYGTALSATQLDATANLQGTLVYTPGFGAVLAAGTQTLSVTFTPNDTADYTTVTATVQLVVNPISVASLSATSLSFGSVYLGSSSNSGTVTLTNPGDIALSITSIALTGTNASSFVFANSCGTSLAAGASCTIHGHFAPAATGALTAAITITDNASNSPQTIALSGTGVEPPVTLSATSLSLGSVYVGLSGNSGTVTLTNTGTATLSITSIAVTGANAASFDFANSCGASLAAGANCTIHGHFAPTKTGALTASVTITDSAVTSPQTIALSGTGLAPPVTLSASSLSYGSVPVGETSGSQTVVITNVGTTTLSITSIAVTGTNASSFVFANSCGTSIAVGANCTVHGHFAPTTTGALTAAITIADNAPTSPQTIALSGTGLPPPVTLSVSSLSFGSATIGTATASQYVTLTNTGTATLSITSIAVTGADASSFAFGNSCGTSLAVGANCSIHGHFAPAKTGALTAAITITDSAATSPQTIALSGTGVAPPVTLSPTSLAFGSITVGETSASQTVTLTNTGTAALSITSIAVTGASASSFVFANSCGTSLAVGANCTFHGHFAPTKAGAITAAITITDSASTSPQTIALSGTGLSSAPVTLSATSLVFPATAVGSSSASDYVTMTNTGTAALTITSIAVTGANASSFVFANTCGTSLAAGASCSIHGHFAPTATGALAAAVTITDSATGSPQTIALTGTGQ